MENKLKAKSTDAIQNLKECDIKTIMATGDNVLTAISVAKSCSILDNTKDIYFGDV